MMNTTRWTRRDELDDYEEDGDEHATRGEDDSKWNMASMIASFVTWLAQLWEWQTAGSCTIQCDEYDVNEGAGGKNDSG